MADILLITGMSGAGRSGAAAVLEDLGWYVIDNLPTSLVDTIVELVSKPGSDIERLALVAGRQQPELLPRMAGLRADGHRVRLLFLDASDTALVKRYDATRRKHPLDGEAAGLVEAIALEREMLQPVKAGADLVIDTTELNIHQLKAKLLAAFDDGIDDHRLQIAVESFGFKHGLPIDADIVMDVRFLPNPHWDDNLATAHRPRPGGPRLRARASTGERLPRPLRGTDALAAAVVRGRGQELPHGGHRVHRRTPSQRRRRGGIGRQVARPRLRGAHRASGSEPLTSGRVGSMAKAS